MRALFVDEEREARQPEMTTFETSGAIYAAIALQLCIMLQCVVNVLNQSGSMCIQVIEKVCMCENVFK